ncbi:MAG TPA: hypothetical protein VK582_04970 [Pyrinomonadaceae bacterium]|nr:hypothetical protein [Pyrinomonadaceae bacterium]
MFASRSRIPGMIISLVLGVGLASNVSAQSRLSDWICRILGIRVQTYNRLSQVRPGEEEPTLGARLMRLKLPEGQEKLVWQCDGCWSPVALSETEAAVLRRDGIWLVPLAERSPAPTQPKIAAQNIVAIIGLLDRQSKQVIVAQRNRSPGCAYVLLQANLSNGEIKELVGPTEKCLEGPNQLLLTINAGRLRDDKLLFAPKNKSDTPRTLWRGTYTQRQDSDKVDYRSERLIPAIDSNDDGVDRYDPNWIKDNEVIYVANP